MMSWYRIRESFLESIIRINSLKSKHHRDCANYLKKRQHQADASSQEALKGLTLQRRMLAEVWAAVIAPAKSDRGLVQCA